jgi:hypothetical protein
LRLYVWFEQPASREHVLRRIVIAAMVVVFCLGALGQDAAPKPDSSPHKVQFVEVDKDVKLEVLDWAARADRSFFLQVSAMTLITSTSLRPNSPHTTTSMASLAEDLALRAPRSPQRKTTRRIDWPTMFWR